MHCPSILCGNAVGELPVDAFIIPDDIFAPSGRALGVRWGQAKGARIALAAILGMAGYIAGMVRALVTAFLIILD